MPRLGSGFDHTWRLGSGEHVWPTPQRTSDNDLGSHENELEESCYISRLLIVLYKASHASGCIYDSCQISTSTSRGNKVSRFNKPTTLRAMGMHRVMRDIVFFSPSARAAPLQQRQNKSNVLSAHGGYQPRVCDLEENKTNAVQGAWYPVALLQLPETACLPPHRRNMAQDETGPPLPLTTSSRRDPEQSSSHYSSR